MKNYRPAAYRAVVSINLPIPTIEKIDEIAYRNKGASRSDVIRQLIESAMFIESKMGLVETWTSKDMEQLREQYEQGGLVDWVHHLDLRKFNTMMHIFDDERKTRGLE